MPRGGCGFRGRLRCRPRRGSCRGRRRSGRRSCRHRRPRPGRGRRRGNRRATGRKLKKLLAVIARSVPFKPVMDSLATVVGVSRNILPDYFLYMEQAGMIGQLRDDTGGIRGIGKVEKVYLDNTNMAYLLGADSTDLGNIRETFFYNQMRVVADVISSRISDFEINGKTFEVGGKKKGYKQLADTKEGYIVKDDIEFSSGNIIPLWAFGLLY